MRKMDGSEKEGSPHVAVPSEVVFVRRGGSYRRSVRRPGLHPWVPVVPTVSKVR